MVALALLFPGYGILAKAFDRTPDVLPPVVAGQSPHSESELKNLANINDCAACHLDTGPGKGLSTGQPGVNNYPATPPGQSTKLARPYPGAPPLVPHSLNGLKITRDNNDCIGCHKSGVEVNPGHVATKIPPSHYDGTEIAYRRFNCLQCHVVQSAEDPPVG